MRVAYFTESLHPHVDGVSRTLSRLYGSLERRAIDFRIYSPFVPGSEVSWSSRVRGVPYVRFPPYPAYRVSLPTTRRIRSDLRNFNPDLVHVVSPTPLAFRAQGLARELGIPVVASFHTHFVSYFRYYGIGRLEPLGWWWLRTFYRRCRRVYVPSESMAAELEAHGLNDLEIWSRGIDVDRFSPAYRTRELVPFAPGEDDLPVLLLVSRLVREKDLADLVAADGILRSRSVRFRLVMVGDGPMRSQLEKSLPHAHFAGHRTGIDLAVWYASSDVFVFPSTTETLGNVVLEAMASGLPPVVVNRGGPPELVEHGRTGFVARGNDPADLADALQPLLEDAALRRSVGEAARAAALEYDWDRINDRLIASYRRIAAQATPSRGGAVAR
jgi:phosphatidylinositol alpha 1,6-mannosyltransferase